MDYSEVVTALTHA